jgi:MoaA/NifB/PqqE/SkfB family radical SAM enzyme
MTQLTFDPFPHEDAHVLAGACQAHRSTVPDLLFEDVRDARVGDIREYLEAPERVDARVALHRLTLFVTYACQLACPYCKTIARTDDDRERWPQKRTAFDLAAFTALLAGIESPITHLHFTGGEPTLARDLPAMVCHARQRGIPHVSLTSNGVAPWPRLEALVDGGVDEIRISLDARDAGLAELMSARPRAWSHAVGNLVALAGRRARHPFFLIVNTVVSGINRTDLPAIVRFLIDLGVDDIKLIASVEETKTLGRGADTGEIVSAIEALLAPLPADAFPLLRRKLRTVFSPHAVGLQGAGGGRGADWRCYIPLTERTADATFYYPCSVYLREGGAPLGSVTDSPAMQREKTARFVRTGNCLADSICQRYCLHCTAGFNVAANDARGSSATGPGR